MRNILVAGFLYHSHKVLLLRRVTSKKFSPGFYERPGGHKEENEDLKIALVREFLEETGLSITVGSHYFEYSHPIGKTNYTEHSFFVKADYISVSLSPEHDKYVWVSKDKLDDYKINPREKIAILNGFESIT